MAQLTKTAAVPSTIATAMVEHFIFLFTFKLYCEPIYLPIEYFISVHYNFFFPTNQDI